MVSRGTRRVRRSGAAGGARRKFIWARTVGTIAVAAETDSSNDLLADFETLYGADLLGCTITRIRGYWMANPATASDTVASAWGIRVTTNTLGAEGPFEQPHADWMSYTPIVLGTGGAAGTDATTAVRHGDIDVRSMRKLDELDQTLSLGVSNRIVGVAMTFDYHLSIGLKLP